VRLARRPRNTTVVGAPAIALKLGHFAAPNLGAAIMNGFMGVWSSKAEPGEDTTGTLFDPPADASGIDGGRRNPGRQRPVATAARATAGLGAAAVATWLWRRRR
jgi:hypothetical protein